MIVTQVAVSVLYIMNVHEGNLPSITSMCCVPLCFWAPQIRTKTQRSPRKTTNISFKEREIISIKRGKNQTNPGRHSDNS